MTETAPVTSRSTDIHGDTRWLLSVLAVSMVVLAATFCTCAIVLSTLQGRANATAVSVVLMIGCLVAAVLAELTSEAPRMRG